MTEAQPQDFAALGLSPEEVAPPRAPLAMPKQVLERRPGGLLQLVLRLPGLTARPQG